MKKLLALLTTLSLAGVFGLADVSLAAHHEKEEDKEKSEEASEDMSGYEETEGDEASDEESEGEDDDGEGGGMA